MTRALVLAFVPLVIGCTGEGTGATQLDGGQDLGLSYSDIASTPDTNITEGGFLPDNGSPTTDGNAAVDLTPGCTPTADKEVCANAKDDDCDGFPDSQDPDCQQCSPTTVEACETEHLGVCADGSRQCELAAGGMWSWSACAPDIEPGSQAEKCSGGVDADCDGKAPADDPDCFCINNTLDGDETDQDCGGSCPGCGQGQSCVNGADCASGTCQGPTVSGGCQQFETSQGVVVKNGKLYSRCMDWSDNQVDREITISGVTVSGGCQQFETLQGVVVKSGKLYSRCMDWSDNQVDREILLDGSTGISGGCQQFETSQGVVVKNGKLYSRCMDWSDNQVDREIVIEGPPTCQ